MGLSDEERWSGLVNVIAKINELFCYHRDDSPNYRRLKKLTKKLWPAFLSQFSNPTHWILGSKAFDQEVGGNDLPGVALMHAAECLKDEDNEFSEENMKKRLKEKNPTLAFLHEFTPDLEKILYDNKLERLAVEMYLWVEKGFYYLNRYNDQFSRSYREVGKIFSNIWATCYEIMNENPTILEAHCIHQLVKVILPYKDDLVSRWWAKDCMHHDMHAGVIGAKRALELWKEWQVKQKKATIEDRILLTLEIAGRRFHYEHQQRGLLDMIEKYNKGKKKKIDVEKVKAMLKKCTEGKKQEDKDQHSRYSHKFCWLTDQSWED